MEDTRENQQLRKPTVELAFPTHQFFDAVLEDSTPHRRRSIVRVEPQGRIEIESVLKNLLTTAGMQGPPAEATPPERARRVLVATDPSVRSAMLGAVNARWDASVRTFTDAADCCRHCGQFCTHIQNEQLYGSLDRLE